jgi:hypothetical protein
LHDDATAGGTLYAPERALVTISATYESSWRDRTRLGKVEVELVLSDGRYEIQRIEATPPRGSALDPEELRLVPFGQLLGFALAGKVRFRDADGRTLSATRPMTDSDPAHGIALRQPFSRYDADARKALIALDLPLKILIWEGDAGETYVSYNESSYLADRYEISDPFRLQTLASTAVLADLIVGSPEG